MLYLTGPGSRFCKPLDGRLVRQMAKNHPVMITVEEGSIGGFGSHGMSLCTCSHGTQCFEALCTQWGMLISEAGQLEQGELPLYNLYMSICIPCNAALVLLQPARPQALRSALQGYSLCHCSDPSTLGQ